MLTSFYSNKSKSQSAVFLFAEKHCSIQLVVVVFVGDLKLSKRFLECFTLNSDINAQI